jgi:hypothetical protein
LACLRCTHCHISLISCLSISRPATAMERARMYDIITISNIGESKLVQCLGLSSDKCLDLFLVKL